MVELLPQHEIFVQEYVRTYSTRTAMTKAGYKGHTSIGTRILNRPDVRLRIKEIHDERDQAFQISEKEIIEQLQKVALADITDYVSWDQDGVMFVDPDKIDGQVVAEIDVTTAKTVDANGRDISRTKKKIKLQDKMKSIELLMKHKQMLTDKLDVTGKVNITILDDIPGSTNDDQTE